MTRAEIAIENHKKGCNCAQAVACAFADKTNLTEDELFKLSEAFGGGMGGTQGVCGAVSAMVIIAGYVKSLGLDSLPNTNKMESYDFAKKLMGEFENKNQTLICSRLKGECIRSCDGCIEDAVNILEKYL